MPEPPTKAPPPAAPAPKPPTARPAAIDKLADASWSEVTKAKLLLDGDRLGSLAALVEMVDRDDRVPLVNTADLIYPGAKQFYGHGYMVPYDLDHLGDRAGWVLEELTFWDFGFSTGINPMGAEDPVHAEARRKAARAAVHGWWKSARSGWSCYDALEDALNSAQPRFAYQWLREWNALPCDGFTVDRFKRGLLPIVRRHAADKTHPMHDQAALLLKDLDEQLARLVIVPVALVRARLGAATASTTVADVEVTLGKAARDIGSGIHIFVYPLADNAEVRVGSPDGGSIMYIRLVENGRETVLYTR